MMIFGVRAIILAFLFFANGIVARSNVGVVGLGRTIFEPLCCYSCLASFWGLTLDCTSRENPKHPIGSSPACHSTNTPYLSSLAYCIQLKCASDNVSVSQRETCWNAVAGDGDVVSSLQDNLPVTPPTTQLAYDASSLSQASLVNDQYYEDSRGTIQRYVKEEAAHALYGTIIIVVVIGFCFYLGFLRLVQYYLPRLSIPRVISTTLSKYLIEPALFGKIHSRRFPWNLGYVPSRALSVLILAYIALNAVLCAINYPTISPDTWYLSSSKQRISFVADRLGILSFANISLAIMFSGRNTPLLWITGRSRTEVLTFHRWVARVAALQGIVHAVLYWTNTNSYGYHLFTLSAGIHAVNFNNNYWSYGIIAVIALGAMISVLSILPVRVAWYELFLVAHIIAAIVILFCLWEHVVLRYHKYYGYEAWLYIAFAIWGFDRGARPLRILLLNWKSWFSRNHPSAVVELLPGGEFVKVTVFPSILWHFNAGQHCFLYFPTTTKNPFQSHPFSIASWNDGTNLTPQTPQEAASLTSLADSTSLEGLSKGRAGPDSGSRPENTIELQTLEATNHQMPNAEPSTPNRPSISFIIRPEQGLTHGIHNRLVKGSKATMSAVFIEGPYGSTDTASLRNADTIVAIAGGIGITSILGYLNLYLTSLCTVSPHDETAAPRKKGRASRFVLFWSAREESLIMAIKSQLADADELRRKGVELNIVCTGEVNDGQSAERLDVFGAIIRELENEHNTGKHVCVVSCGPGGMADVVRAAVVRSIGKNGVDVELIEDAFAW